MLSSPALDPGLNPVQKLLVAVLPALFPKLRVGNGLDARLISHDPAVVAAYQSDPLVHDRIAARLARFIADDSAAVRAAAPGWALPTLLLYAGADKLVNPAGSRAFAAAAPAQVLSSQCFESLYHEIFNEAEPGRSQVLAALARLAGRPVCCIKPCANAVSDPVWLKHRNRGPGPQAATWRGLANCSSPCLRGSPALF